MDIYRGYTLFTRAPLMFFEAQFSLLVFSRFLMLQVGEIYFTKCIVQNLLYEWNN